MSETVLRSGVRVLTAADTDGAVRLLAASPIDNVFVASRVRSSGLEARDLGCPIWGYEEDGRLRAMCHAGSNLVPVNASPQAVAAFAQYAGPRRMCSSIIGPAPAAMDLWQQLSALWGSVWSQTREVREHQPVLAMDTDPLVPIDPGVKPMTITHWDAYYRAAVRMYTEEVGVSPLQGNPAGYRYYVRQLITSGRAFGVVDGDRVIFKADLGSVSAGVTQVQGVWLDPSLRGRGLAPAMMAAVVQYARRIAPVVSLYVNDFNAPARATYARVGFRQAGEFATILY
ncbi:N-acetyltransferase GCN5 [Microlunatus endophyticus]|uniref:N-acetyltransferase GCN5 n=1 Tax=Microlunatus endophyticus TaxID=1716077 RepID=A0A917W695_9ACTN|nr:GNAT family N-acetyltransferase [Microlunatus endophyticus]GGL67677.1 N-acetyltransferase GCN5 [Microlunatus endophyticus]